MTATTAAGLAAGLLAVLHLAARWLVRPGSVPEQVWLSAASGVSLAYVFGQLLPEVARVGAGPATADSTVVRGLQDNVWLLALAGLLAFYALEHHAKAARADRGGGPTPDRVGWVHVASFAAYNVVVGALLVDQAEDGSSSLVLFSLALGIHFLVNDRNLREDHGRLYHDRGRYLLAAGVLAGWGLGVLIDPSDALLGLPLAFLAGAIVLAVVKEELPAERRGHVVPLVVGALAFSALVLAV